MAKFQRVVPCLWFDSEAEEAAKFYTSIFDNSGIVRVTRFTAAGQEVHGKPEGSVMTVVFTLDGQEFTALNAARTSSSPRPYRSRCSVRPRRRSTTTGRG